MSRRVRVAAWAAGRSLAAGVVLLLASSSSGCWVAQNGPVSAEYARQVSVASVRVAQLEAAMTEAEARVAQLEEYARTQGASQATSLDNLAEVNAEMGRLRGQIEELNFDVQALTARLDQESVAYERRALHAELRLGQLERMIGARPVPMPTDADLGIAGASAPAEEVELPANIGGKLDLAVKLMKSGDNDGARTVLDAALRDHVGAPETAEVRYRIGESHFNDGRWGTAARSFQLVVDNHEKSDWAAWAILRQGECFEELGQAENAKVFYEDVVARYPKTDAAKEAKAHLD